MSDTSATRRLAVPSNGIMASNEQARDVVAALSANARTTAEVLQELRRAFPDMPLSERVAALAAVTRI